MSIILDEIINLDGTYNYAYMVMVMDKNIYVNPAIVFADSIRKIGCLGDLVVIIDDKISEESIYILKKFYNKIIKINNSIVINELKIKDEKQKIILNKIEVFNLYNYKKIFLIDVDTIIFSNLDNFFLIKQNFKKTIYSINIDNLGFILFEPSKETYSLIINFIKKNKSKIESESKPLLYIINNTLDIKKMENIHISSDKYENCDGIQYRKDKPFLMKSDLTIEERIRLNHFKVWFSYLNNILNKYKELKKYKIIQESIDISKYFLASLSRFIINFLKINKNKKEDNIKHIYGDNKYNIVEYYHLDITREYCSEKVNFNLNTYDIDFFLEYLNEITKSKTKLKLFKGFLGTKPKDIINKIKDNKTRNIFLNNYVKLLPNVFVVIQINEIGEKEPLDLPDLENNFVYDQKFLIERKTLINILFNLYQYFTYEQRIELFKNFSSENYEVTINLFETIRQLDITDSNFNNNLFVINDFDTKTRVSSIFFNPNSINKYKDIETLNFINFKSNQIKINKENLLHIIFFQTLKKWIFNTYSGEQIGNLLFIKKNYDDYLLIDDNKHNINIIKKININKVFFINIIFSQSSQYKEILSKQKIDISNIHNIDKYWEIEGLKFSL
jgi:hypothetical protein